MSSENFEHDIENVTRVLQSGGIILYPTDTIWGIGCDATNEQAVKKIYDLKKRSTSKAMIVLVGGERDIIRYVANVDLEVFNFLGETTKPTTVIYNTAVGLAENLVAKDGSIAIRIVKDAFCKALIKRFRKPLVSTSANLSGENPPANFSEISDAIISGVDYVVKYRQDDTGSGTSSAIIKLNKDGTITTVRE